MQKSDVRSMNNDAKFDADVKFDKEQTRDSAHIGSQNVSDTDEVADATFI